MQKFGKHGLYFIVYIEFYLKLAHNRLFIIGPPQILGIVFPFNPLGHKLLQVRHYTEKIPRRDEQ